MAGFHRRKAHTSFREYPSTGSTVEEREHGDTHIYPLTHARAHTHAHHKTVMFKLSFFLKANKQHNIKTYMK